VAGVLFAFWAPLRSMLGLWSGSPMYSYAYTVPFISAFLVWSRRHEIMRQPPKPALIAGSIVLAGSILLLLIGQLASVQTLQQLAFVPAVVAIVLLVLGGQHLKLCAGGIVYLLFMVPVWDVLTESLHEPFQHNSAKLGVALMHAIGVPAYRDNTVITLPNVVMEVARECSGVNYLIAVLALALPLSYLRLRGIWRPTVLIASSIAIAAFANGVRVALIGTLAYKDIGSPLHGPFHTLHGLFVSAVGYIVLFAGLHFLQSDSDLPATSTSDADASPAARRSASVPFSALALAVAFAVVGVVAIGLKPRPVPLPSPLDTLPSRLGAWSIDAFASRNTDTALSIWNADQHLTRTYRSSQGQKVTVDVWYFEVQRQSREVINAKSAELHRTSTPIALTLPGGAVLNANMLKVQEDGQFGLFWYDIGGVAESGEYAAMMRSIWNGFASHRNNAAAILVRAPSDTGKGDDAVAALKQFAEELYPALTPYGFAPSRIVLSKTAAASS
jgi:EpsI family protein